MPNTAAPPLRPAPLLVAAALLALLTACGGGDGEKGGGGDASDAPPADCNPIAPALSCLLPFPSDVWRGSEGVVVPDAALPLFDIGGDAVPTPLNPLFLHPASGFSPVPTLVAAFDEVLDDEPLVGYTEDPELSRLAASPTVLIDAETGDRIAHFAELDAMADPTAPRVLVIHPLVRLRDGARYVVAIHGLSTPDGAPASPPASFTALREGTSGWTTLQARYDAELFPVIEAAGVPRAELQLAWDFTVREREDATGDMLAARQIAIDNLTEADPVVTITEVVDDVDANIRRRVAGTLRVPLILEADAPLSLIHRDGAGAVAEHGWIDVPFTVLIPVSGEAPLRALQFGHGFFGDRSEMEGIGASMGPATGTAFFGIDWVGMSKDDLVDVAAALANDPLHGLAFTDRVHQAMVNQIFFTRAIETTLAAEPSLQDDDGAPLYDADHVYFYGISMGHILGGVYAGLSPDIDRFALSVGGASFSLMMMRALPFESFARIILAGVPDSAGLLQFTALSQTTFDRIDPGVYAPYVRDELLPGGPASREVIIQMGIGDSQVPNAGSHLHARTLGLPLMTPTPRAIWGLTEQAYPSLGSGLVEMDFGMEAPLAGDVGDLDWESNEVHGAVRLSPEGQAQLDAFLQPNGTIPGTCEGPCDPH